MICLNECFIHACVRKSKHLTGWKGKVTSKAILGSLSFQNVALLNDISANEADVEGICLHQVVSKPTWVNPNPHKVGMGFLAPKNNFCLLLTINQ